MSITSLQPDVRALLDNLYEAWADNDADAFVRHYVPDATVSMTGSYAADREQVRQHMSAAFAGPLRGSRGVDTPQSVRFVTDDVCVVNSLAGILMAGETTLPSERERLATWVLVRTDDGWKVSAYSNCPAH